MPTPGSSGEVPVVSKNSPAVGEHMCGVSLVEAEAGAVEFPDFSGGAGNGLSETESLVSTSPANEPDLGRSRGRNGEADCMPGSGVS